MGDKWELIITIVGLVISKDKGTCTYLIYFGEKNYE